MKAIMGKDIKTILNDPQGKQQFQSFIGSDKNTGSIELSNGDTYRIMPANSKEFSDFMAEKELLKK